MRKELASPIANPFPLDGWLGTRELPGYRAGNVVAKLADLPQVDPDHLYFDLLLLDAKGQLRDNHSGPCHALPSGLPQDAHTLDERLAKSFYLRGHLTPSMTVEHGVEKYNVCARGFPSWDGDKFILEF